jgi:hypothetical protein
MDTGDLLLGELLPDGPEDPDTSEDDTGRPGDLHSEQLTVVVIVFAPKDPEPKRFRFRLDETVGEAAKFAAEKFGYEVGTPSFQTESDVVLDRTLTLRAAGVHNGEKLELVDAGGGV